jgi:hypothetical protein
LNGNPARLFGRGVQNVAELIPARTGPALQPHLGKVHIDLVGRDAGQRRRQDNIPEIPGPLDDIFARQIAAALLDDLLEEASWSDTWRRFFLRYRS